MRIRTNLTDISAQSVTTTPQTQTQPVYARVISIVNSKQDSDYEEFGKVEALGGIRYRLIKSSTNEEDSSTLQFAYPAYSHIKQVPLLNEIVEIREGMTYSLESATYPARTYYFPTVNIWNNANHNALPDVNVNPTEASLGKDIPERDNLSTLQPFPGDTILEGRLGNSIRISGYIHPDNILTTQDNNSDPFIIIKNSKQPSTNVLDSYVEDINVDDSSIYLTSNHIVPITPLYTDKKSLSTTSKVSYDYVPTQEDKFKGKQLIGKSDRIVLQAKTDSIILSARQATSVAAQSINLDSTQYIGLDSPKIFLGNKAKITQDQPVLKGTDTVEWLEELVDVLLKISKDFSKIADPNSAVAILQKLAVTLPPTLNRLKSELSSLKSKKVFTE